jgi:hypothetical protein
VVGCFYAVLRHFQQYFSYIVAVSFIGGGNRLPVQSVPITTKVVSLNRVHGKVNSIQHYVIKFISDLRQSQVVGFDGPMEQQNKGYTVNESF